MNINLDNEGVFTDEITREQAREFFDQEDSDLADKLESLVDEAQGYVGISGKSAFIVIEVKP